MIQSEARPATILLVEDNLQDIEITRRAFAKGRVNHELVVVRDGAEALDYLHRRGKYREPASAPRPGMILLDLNLPRIGGMEVLQHIKNDRELRSIPVIVLTVSEREQDVAQSYELGVNTYIQKPIEFDDFQRVITAVQEYWTLIATLPPSNGRPPA